MTAQYSTYYTRGHTSTNSTYFCSQCNNSISLVLFNLFMLDKNRSLWPASRHSLMMMMMMILLHYFARSLFGTKNDSFNKNFCHKPVSLISVVHKGSKLTHLHKTYQACEYDS